MNSEEAAAVLSEPVFTVTEVETRGFSWSKLNRAADVHLLSSGPDPGSTVAINTGDLGSAPTCDEFNVSSIKGCGIKTKLRL